jgi:phage terminase small subunit
VSAATDTSTRALTERQRRFAEHYAASGNGAYSARRAGYSNKSDGARIAAQEVLSNPNVVALVGELRKEHLSKIGVRPERVLEELASSAFVDPRDAFDEDGNVLSIRRMPHRVRRAIKKIKVREHYCKKTGEMTGRDVEVEFNDKLRANEILGRHLGVLKEQPVQVAQTNVFAEIIAAAQGSSLQPIAQRGDGDTANEIEGDVIDGEVIEKEGTPAQPMASSDALAAFNAIADYDEDEGEDESASAQPSQQKTEAEIAAAVSETERNSFPTLWKRRRRNL